LASDPNFITLGSVKTNRVTNALPRPGYGPPPTPRANRRRSHISTARAGILGVLIDQREPCAIAALSALTRQHPNTIREHLDGLVDDQLAIRTRAPVQGRGRPAWLYSAAPDIASETGASEYAALASVLAAQIARISQNPREDSIEAGRMWGRELVRGSQPADYQTSPAVAPVPDGTTDTGDISDQRAGGVVAADEPALTGRAPSAKAARREVVTLLEQLGFAPSPDARINVVKLKRCPLLETANKYPAVVCAVHLGVVRGALEELGADPAQTERTALEPFSEPGACRLDLVPRPTTAG
jgi:predicted ArsR family transcriptional regulator